LNAIEAFHLAGTKRQRNVCDSETLLLILVGKLDEAVSYLFAAPKMGRSISSLTPSDKAKITAATEAAKALGLDQTT